MISVPPGTEMFQFPGFASRPYGLGPGYPCGWVAPFGYPRIKACSRLPMAFRSVPRPSSPPGAKASTECPSHTRSMPLDGSKDTPCTETILRLSQGMFPQEQPRNIRRSFRLELSSHITGSCLMASPSSACADTGQTDQTVSSHASEHSPPTTGALIPKDSSPGQTCSRTTGPPPIHTDQL